MQIYTPFKSTINQPITTFFTSQHGAENSKQCLTLAFILSDLWLKVSKSLKNQLGRNL